MDFWSTVLVLVRRWYVAVPVLMVAALGLGYLYTSTPPRHVSSSIVVLTMPLGGPTAVTDPSFTPTLTNPLLNFTGSIDNTRALLVQSLTTPRVLSELGLPDASDTVVQINGGSENPELLIRGPFLFVTADSRSPDRAEAVVREVVERARAELVAHQESLGADPSTFLGFTELVPPSAAVEVSGGSERAAAVGLALALVLALTATYAVESALSARPRRSPPTGSPSTGSPPSRPSADSAGSFDSSVAASTAQMTAGR